MFAEGILCWRQQKSKGKKGKINDQGKETISDFRQQENVQNFGSQFQVYVKQDYSFSIGAVIRYLRFTVYLLNELSYRESNEKYFVPLILLIFRYNGACKKVVLLLTQRRCINKSKWLKVTREPRTTKRHSEKPCQLVFLRETAGTARMTAVDYVGLKSYYCFWSTCNASCAMV